MWWQGSGIPYRSSQSLFPGRRQWDCFREGGSEKVSGFGNYSSKAFLILFFSGKPEMWGTRDKSLHWCVRLLRTCCRFAAAVEADAKGCLLEGRDENSGEGFQVNVDVECCEVPTSMIDYAYWCSLLTRVASVRGKSTWVWCAACLAQLYGARLYTLWYSTWRWVFKFFWILCLALHCVHNQMHIIA